MPNTTPKSPDLYSLIFEMNNTLGRNTQMVADVKDNVDTIKSVQGNQIVQITQLKQSLDEHIKDVNELKLACAAHEARTTALELKDRDRANKMKGAIAVWSIVSASVMLLLSNLGTVIEFITHFWVTHDAAPPITPPDP